MHSNGSTVAAVIVTRDRPDDVTARCQELHQQTRPPEYTIVVDNGSTDEAARTIQQRYPDVLVLRLPTNLGPAGGFAAGFAKGLELGCDFIWAMDDDLEPQGDCLEALLSEVTPGTPRVVLPTRSSEVGHSDLNRGWYGCLIPAQVVRAVGGPRADFFWWAEDVEFFIRVRTAGFPVVTSPRAGVWHRLHRAPRDYPAWKLYYEARNSLYYRLHLRRNRSKFVQSLIKIIVRTAVMLPRRGNRMKRLAMTFRGCRDGIAGRLGKTVDPVRS